MDAHVYRFQVEIFVLEIYRWKEYPVEDVSRGLAVSACLISGIPSRKLCYALEKRAYTVTKRELISRFRGSLKGCSETNENQNAFVND